MSTAATPLERAQRQPLMPGLFLPIQNGGWTPSSAPRGTDWGLYYNSKLAVRAEELDFGLTFAQWLGEDGHGSETKYRKYSLDPLLITIGTAALTRHIILISTVHVLYDWHPLHLAEVGATLDHMIGGRWGLNLVTEFCPHEMDMFGLDTIPRDQPYAMATQFTKMRERLWREDANITCDSDHWSLHYAYVSPRSAYGRPIIVSVGSSDAGLAYATQYYDLFSSPVRPAPISAMHWRPSQAYPTHPRSRRRAGPFH